MIIEIKTENYLSWLRNSLL